MVMRSKLTSGCSFAETGQVILSAEFVRENTFGKQSYWGCLTKVLVFGKYFTYHSNYFCLWYCVILKASGLNMINGLKHIHHISLIGILNHGQFSWQSGIYICEKRLQSAIVFQCCAAHVMLQLQRREAPLNPAHSHSTVQAVMMHTFNSWGLQFNVSVLLLIDELNSAWYSCAKHFRYK